MSSKNQGFASLSPERMREIASSGGKAVPKQLRSFSQSKKLAQLAGSKGGSALAPEQRSFSQNRELAREAGRKGGLAKEAKKRAKIKAKPPSVAAE